MSRARELLGDMAQSRLGQLAVRMAGAERMTLVILMVAAGVVVGFLELAEAVGEGDTRAFDERLLLALRTPGNPADPLGPKQFEEMMRDFTALGSTGVLTLAVLAIAGFLVMTRKAHAALFVIAAVVGGVLISQGTKWAYGRPRPDLVPHGAEVYTASFPSGHAMMSAVVYLTLGALLARTQADRRVKFYLLAVAVTGTILVGISRVYLGVHWPSDVLAGWALGSAWALICWLVMTWLQGRGQVEREGQT